METREDYNFSTLSERISAQTEAYVEFSNALVKIIEQTASIRDKVDHSLEDSKSLNLKFNDFLIEFNKFNSQTNNYHFNFDKDLENIKNILSKYEGNLEEGNAIFFGTVEELKNNLKVSHDIISVGNEEIKELTKKIENQVVVINNFKEVFDKVKMFFAVFLSVMGIIALLLAFKVVSISWLVK